jgi:AAA ATPase-like protein
LASRLEDRDRHRFVGRKAELALLESYLDDEPPASVVLVYGPGGIGKSTLLRELGRRARGRGWDTFVLEGRDLAPTPDALEAVLATARDSPQPLVLIDTYERMTALGGYLRRGLLPSLPERAIVVIAGRHEPEAAWFTGGWEGVASELELRPFGPDDSQRLLAAHGLEDDRTEAIVDWADGSPLALALAADVAASDDEWQPNVDVERPEVLRGLIRRLVDSELRGVRLSAILVAAIARVTTPEMLRVVLPDSDAESAYQRLRELTFTEPLGDGLTLHDLVRKALVADFRRGDPERERELRRRIVDYLYERARGGEMLLTIDMAHLIESDAVRWGYGWDGSRNHRIDELRPGDAEQVGEFLAAQHFPEWWPMTLRFFENAPERVAVVRDRDDRLCGYFISMTPANAPPFADEDPLMGPWLAHARAERDQGDSVMWRDSIDFTGDPRGRVQAMLGMAGILRSGSANPRFAYMPINPARPAALAFAKALGATHIEQLDFAIGDRVIECHRIDYGPGGLLATQRAMVYAELGLAAPGAYGAPKISTEDVRQALRDFRVPHALANSPLASGETAEARVESVRALLTGAVDRAFGDTEGERLLQRVLVCGYIEPVASHEQAALDLSLSRAAYFRRLRVAAERVADYIVSARPTAG